jgi:protein N-lysine methyltransferase METTL21A
MSTQDPASSPPSSPELSLLGISEDFIPVRQQKIAGQTELSFGGLLDPPLLLHEDLKEGCGGQSWPAGMVLAKYLLKDLDSIKGKTMYVALILDINTLK